MGGRKMDNVLNSFFEAGINSRIRGLMTGAESAKRFLEATNRSQIDIDMAEVQKLIGVVASETHCHLKVKFCFYGVQTGKDGKDVKVLQTIGDSSSLCQYFAVVADEGNASATLFIHVPTRIVDKAKKFGENVTNVLGEIGGAEAAKKYSDEITNVANWAQSQASWKFLKLWVVTDEGELSGDMPKERIEKAQSFATANLKSMLYEQNEGTGAEMKQGFLLRLYVPGLDPRANLTKAIIKQYGLKEGVARIIAKSITDKVGKVQVDFYRAIRKYQAFVDALKESVIVSGNLATADGLAGKNPEREVAAFLRKKEKGFQLLLYIPSFKSEE
jgi:hypothetical protein